MLPYSNRIRHGQFTHDKKNITLSDADNHAIHGALRKCAWRITEQAKHTVTAEYDTHIDGEVNWPWPVRATTSYTLTDNQLISQMTLTNLGSSSMPAGMGWHPYFCRSIDGAAPELRISVDGMYPDTNGDCLPTGAPIPLSKELDFSDSRKLDPTQRIDHCFAGFTSPATLHWPDAGIQIQMLASENCTHLVLYNPDEPYFAVEPVTNANDGFNLSEKGVASGVTILQPEQSLTAHMSLVLDIKCTD